MTFPDFSFEEIALKKGYKVIAGVDEVGRGSFAGPVVAGCVAFCQIENIKLQNTSSEKNSGFRTNISGLISINDSKKLSPKQRELASFWIKRNALCYGIGKASVGEINRFGIKKAGEMAFRRAIKNCGRRIDFLLIDAFYIPYTKGLRRRNQMPIVKGDKKSISIAAASVVAKFYRDKLMTDLGRKPKYKKYLWRKNKGYGTKQHREMILKYGICRLHRKQFIETWQSGF